MAHWLDRHIAAQGTELTALVHAATAGDAGELEEPTPEQMDDYSQWHDTARDHGASREYMPDPGLTFLLRWNSAGGYWQAIWYNLRTRQQAEGWSNASATLVLNSWRIGVTVLSWAVTA